MKIIVKQPGERSYADLAFSEFPTITSVNSVTVQARGMVPNAVALTAFETFSTNVLRLTLTGGTDGERYLVTATVVGSNGLRIEGEVEVVVLELTWAMPDGGAPMLSIAEFVAQFGIDEVVRMTDERGDGRVGKDRLVSALTAAQALAEAHISGRYALPLATVPVLIKSTIADIARGRLYPGTAPDGVASLAKAAIRTLESIKDGKLPVPGASSASEVTSESPILFHSGGRAYPDGLKDFGL